MNDDILVKFENVSKQFQLDDGPVEVLKNVNFTIRRGSFTIIYGPSGSGKSTLLNVLTGLEPPTSGSVVVDGKHLYTLNADERAAFRARTMGLVYQTNYWVNSLSALENVALPLYLTGRSYQESIGEAKASIHRVGLDKYMDYRPNLLSGGQQQRISMARASIISPMLLVADEPTGNLDSKNGDMIMQLVQSFKSDFGSTIVLVTHNLDYLPLSDYRLYIKDGVVTEEQGVYKGPQKPKDDDVMLKAKLPKAVMDFRPAHPEMRTRKDGGNS